MGLHVLSNSGSRDSEETEDWLTTTTDTSTSHTISFSDKDPGDWFDVLMYRDAMFGTTVFAVSAGQSMCPHEGNTDKRELPRIEVSMSAQPPGRTVVPPSAYEVGLSLINDAEEEMTYQPTRVHSKDGEGAIVVINGDSLEKPRLYTLKKDDVLNEVVFIYKGTNKAPVHGAATHDVTLALSSTCDSEISSQQTIRRHFCKSAQRFSGLGLSSMTKRLL